MRVWARTLALACLLLIVVWAAWRFVAAPLPSFLTAPANEQKLALTSLSSVHIATVLKEKEWQVFAIPGGDRQVKLITNANTATPEELRHLRALDPGRRWRYALEIEVSDRNGKILIQRIHHHRADFTEIRWPDGQIFTPAFYLRENLAPLSANILQLDLDAFPEASQLRVRLASKDAEIVDVGLRAYLPEKNSEERVATLWQRLSEKKKKALARASVYPPELLIEQEKRNLLLNTWHAVGPKGREGRDYQQRELYVLMDNDGESVDEPIAPFGVPADARVWATFPIPGQGGRIRLSFQAVAPLSGDRRDTLQGEVRLRWYGTRQLARRELRIPLSEALAAPYSLPLAGGLLEVEAPVEISVRAFLLGRGEQEEEITPPPQYLRTFVADQDNPVVFALEARSEKSMLRLSVRHQRYENRPAQAAAAYSMLDEAGQILKQGVLPLALPDSHYERVLADYTGAWLTDAGTYHFMLPPAARSVRISSVPVAAGQVPVPLLVSAQTRPVRLAREMRIPEDYFDFDATGQRIPAWFVLRPANYEESIVNNRSRLLTIQARPSEENAGLLSGNYQWEDFRPQGNWLARPIYTPREPGTPYRDETLPTTYTRVPNQRSMDFDFPVYQGGSVVIPSVIRIGDEAPFTLKLQIDGQAPLILRGQGPFVEIPLPAMSTGKHRLYLEGEGKVYLNYLRPGTEALVRHMAQRFGGRLIFDYERKAAVDETLTLRVYQPAGKGRQAQLSVRLQGPDLPLMTPLAGWFFDERNIQVSAGEEASASVFGTLGERCDSGQPMYIPFKADAPLGRYRIEVSSPPTKDAYLGISRLGPPVAALRRSHTQMELNRVEFLP